MAVTVVTGVVSGFGSGSCKSGFQPFFRNLAKSGSDHICTRICWIWQMLEQLKYVQLISDKTSAADLSSGVFAISISVTWTKI